MITFLKTHYISVIGVIILAVILVYGGCQLLETREFVQTVNTQTNQANTAVKQAINAQNAAVNLDIQRQTEDAVRERIIAPKLDDARQRSNTSKTDLARAKRKLNETEKILHNSNASRADNCAELRRLFPDQKFEYCHD